MDRHRIPIEQYAGSVATLATLAVIAGYRPAGIGAMRFDPVGIGIGFYSALAVMESRVEALRTRNTALISEAEAAATPEAVLAALTASAEERDKNSAELASLVPQAAAEKARREAERIAPAAANAVMGSGVTIEAVKPDKAPTPFATFGHQLQAIANSAIAKAEGRGAADPRLLAIHDFARSEIGAVTGASEIVGADGGFLVQSDIQNDIVASIFSQAVFAPLAKKREVGAGFNGVKFNVIDETSRATGSRYGGVRVYWTAEGGQKTASRPKIRQEELTLQKLAGLYVATDELLQDTVALESFVRPAFEAEMAFAVDDAMFRGSGAGMPLGILNSPALISVAKETGQDPDTIVYENLIAMLGRFSPTSVRNARFYMNQAVWAALPLMTLTIGTGGVPVFLPPGGVSDAPFGTLLQRPIEVTEYSSAIGDVGDIVLADWSEYMLLQKGGVAQDTSIHVYFDTDETVFRWVLRVNGRPIRTAPVTPYKGTATTSPFVTLAAR